MALPSTVQDQEVGEVQSLTRMVLSLVDICRQEWRVWSWVTLCVIPVSRRCREDSTQILASLGTSVVLYVRSGVTHVVGECLSQSSKLGIGFGGSLLLS